MQPYLFDIIVIGGGASGLAAAIEAKRYGGSDCRVAVIEKNTRLGKKILATGNGRCNLGNIEEKRFVHYSGTCTDLIKPLFEKFEGSEYFFKSMGVICRTDSGRLYPYSNHAASVLDALRFQLQDLGVDIFTDMEVVSLKYDDNSIWTIITGSDKFITKKVIISCGGKAAPSMGTDGSFYKILSAVGCEPSSLKPALCPAYTDQSLLKYLKGIRATAKVSLYNSKGKLLHSDNGEVQFTDKTLSGICIFNLAAFAVEEDMYIQLDLLPHLTDIELNELLWDVYAKRSMWNIEDMLSGIFQKKMCHALFKSSGIASDMKLPVYNLTPYDIERLSNTIKAWTFPVLWFGDWKQAQTTSGGIERNQIKNTLESINCPGLYFSGEILDIAGECGGYNLAWAWCSGTYAAHNAVDSLKGCDNCDKNI